MWENSGTHPNETSQRSTLTPFCKPTPGRSKVPTWQPFKAASLRQVRLLFQHYFLLFPFYCTYLGDTGEQNSTAFKYTTPQHIICTLHCVLTSLSQVSVHHPLSPLYPPPPSPPSLPPAVTTLWSPSVTDIIFFEKMKWMGREANPRGL